MKAVLKSAGLPHVVAVQSARAIIDKLCLGRFDVLITSDQLPDLDAWRLARIVQSGRFGEHLLRIIVVCEDNAVSLLCASAANGCRSQTDHQCTLAPGNATTLSGAAMWAR